MRCTGKVVTLLSSRLKSLMFPAKQEEVMSFDEGITFLHMLDGKASGCPQWFLSLHNVASSMENPQLSRYTRREHLAILLINKNTSTFGHEAVVLS